MRQLKIKKNKSGNNKAGFYVKARFMIGDADGYEKEEYGPFTNEQACMDFLDMLDSIDDDEHFRLEKGIILDENVPKCNIYWAREEFYDLPEKYFEIPEAKKSFITEDLICEIDFNIPMEPYGDRRCALTDYEVYYLDEENKKFKVEYECDDNCGNDPEELAEMRADGEEINDPRTWLYPTDYTEDDFDEFKVVVMDEGDGQSYYTSCDKDWLESYKKGTVTTWSHGKSVKRILIKYKVDDWPGLLKNNPWRDINGNILEDQED